MSEANLNAMTQALRDSLIQTLEGGYNIGNITSALGSIADAANGVASAANNAAQALANMGAAQADMNSKTLYRIEGVAGGTITSHDKASLDKLVKQYGHGTVAPVKYAKGTRNSKGGISVTDEEGYELKLDNLGAGKYTIMNEGSQVLTKPETDNIFGWAKLDPDMFNLQMPLVDMPKYTPEMVRTNNQNVNLNYGSLITVNGDVNDTKHFLGQMETVAEKAITKTFRDFTHTLKYRG